jgi:hypothetical protein
LDSLERVLQEKGTEVYRDEASYYARALELYGNDANPQAIKEELASA